MNPLTTGPRSGRQDQFAFIDQPRFVARREYQGVVDQVCQPLINSPAVRGIFGFGNTGHPGISDIDLLVVLEQDAKFEVNPLTSLSPKDRYLFTHNVVGIPIQLVEQFATFTPDQNANHIWGENLDLAANSRTSDESRRLDNQVALEFLVKYLIDLTIQHEYGVMKLRPLLQTLKATKYSLELMNVEDGNFFDLALECRNVIDSWFEHSDCLSIVTGLIPRFRKRLAEHLTDTLRTTPLSTPSGRRFAFSSNVHVQSGSEIRWSRTGMKFPKQIGLLGKRAVNLQDRMNQFHFVLPYEVSEDAFLRDRFEFLGRLKAYMNDHAPCFSSPMPPLFAYAV